MEACYIQLQLIYEKSKLICNNPNADYIPHYLCCFEPFSVSTYQGALLGTPLTNSVDAAMLFKLDNLKMMRERSSYLSRINYLSLLHYFLAFPKMLYICMLRTLPCYFHSNWKLLMMYRTIHCLNASPK